MMSNHGPRAPCGPCFDVDATMIRLLFDLERENHGHTGGEPG